MVELQRRLESISTSDPDEQARLADEVAQAWETAGGLLLSQLDDSDVRRWARRHLIDRLSEEQATALSVNLLDYPEDFAPGRRDRTTASVVHALSDDQLDGHLPMLAGSNAASTLWDRIARSGEGAVMEAVELVMRVGDVRTRETTLHLLVLDPYGPEHLSHEYQDRILVQALDDPDPEIRGLAAEVIAAEMPDELLGRWESAPLDDGERMRMAFWQTALAHQPDKAIKAANDMVLDHHQPLEARRSALLALGENISTRTAAPVLQAMLTGEDRALAEDAAQLMWRHHRAPDIANAAAESEFKSVRELANRLLHPEMGSPAAGGSRPGDPTRTAEIFDQLHPRDKEQS